MSLESNPGSGALCVVLGRNSSDGVAHGGRNLAPPQAAYRRVQVAATDHPATDRWIVLTTVRLVPSPLYRVGAVDGHNRPTKPHRDYSTLRRARSAANRLYAQLTEENDR
jgi:hypothetical protein